MPLHFALFLILLACMAAMIIRHNVLFRRQLDELNAKYPSATNSRNDVNDSDVWAEDY